MARKQEKRQKRQLRGLPEAARRGQTAPLALFALCVSFLLSNAVTNAQTNCVAGKYQATAGVESVCVRGRDGGGRLGQKRSAYSMMCMYM